VAGAGETTVVNPLGCSGRQQQLQPVTVKDRVSDAMATSCWRRTIYPANVVGTQSCRLLSNSRILLEHLVDRHSRVPTNSPHKICEKSRNQQQTRRSYIKRSHSTAASISLKVQNWKITYFMQ